MHKSVNHAAEEYVRGDVTTNTVEGYFSIFKGVYQHGGKQHLHRYAAEFASATATSRPTGFKLLPAQP